MTTVEDDGPHLRPEFPPVVRTVYSEMTNLQAGQEALIIADSRTPANCDTGSRAGGSDPPR